MNNIVEGGCDIGFGWFTKVIVFIIAIIFFTTVGKSYFQYEEVLIGLFDLLPVMFLMLLISGLFTVTTVFVVNYTSEGDKNDQE